MIIEAIERLAKEGYKSLIFGSSLEPRGFLAGGIQGPKLVKLNFKDDDVDVIASQLLNADQYRDLEEDGQAAGYLDIKSGLKLKFNATLIEGQLVVVIKIITNSASLKFNNIKDLYGALRASLEQSQITYLGCPQPVYKNVISNIDQFNSSGGQVVSMVNVAAMDDDITDQRNMLSIIVTDDNLDNLINLFSDEMFLDGIFIINADLVNRATLDMLYSLSLNGAKIIMMSSKNTLDSVKNGVRIIEDRSDVSIESVIICSELNNVDNTTTLIVQSITRKAGGIRDDGFSGPMSSNIKSLISKFKRGEIKFDSSNFHYGLDDPSVAEHITEALSDR